MASSDKEYATEQCDMWNHRGPVVLSPLFDWPPRPWAAFLTVTKRWVTISRNVLFLCLAMCVYNYFLPDLTAMRSLSLDWIVPIFVRNALLLSVVAGGLHLFLFAFHKQGKKLKFDHRETMDKNKLYTFGNQVHDNMFWSLASGVSVWTLYEVVYFWGIANQVFPVLEFSNAPMIFIIWLLVLPVLLSTHFYFIHVLLHWPLLFDHVHRLHHRNVQIGPWAGMSMHPVEHLLYISSVLVHFVIPSHPVVVLLHLYTRCMAPAFSHAGFEKIVVNDKILTEAADFHHQLHHKFFDCNYGNVDTPWDRWLNTLHDGSDAASVAIRERRRQLRQQRSA